MSDCCWRPNKSRGKKKNLLGARRWNEVSLVVYFLIRTSGFWYWSINKTIWFGREGCLCMRCIIQAWFESPAWQNNPGWWQTSVYSLYSRVYNSIDNNTREPCHVNNAAKRWIHSLWPPSRIGFGFFHFHSIPNQANRSWCGREKNSIAYAHVRLTRLHVQSKMKPSDATRSGP